jgi:hypothetical protein
MAYTLYRLCVFGAFVRVIMHVFPDVDGGPGVTWYPRSGLVAYGGRLYFARDKGDYLVLGDAVQKRSRVRIDVRGNFLVKNPHTMVLWFADLGADAEGNLIFAYAYKCGNLRSTVVFLRAQSLIRERAASHIAMRKAKQLAFAMAWHERLGSECAISSLPVDLIGVIIGIHG